MPDPHLRLQPTIEHRKGRTILTHRWMAPEEGAERVWPLTKPAPPEGDTLRGPGWALTLRRPSKTRRPFSMTL